MNTYTPGYGKFVPGTQLTLEGIRLAYSKQVAEVDRLRALNSDLIDALYAAGEGLEYACAKLNNLTINGHRQLVARLATVTGAIAKAQS